MSWKDILKGYLFGKRIYFYSILPAYPFETGGTFVDKAKKPEYQEQYEFLKKAFNITGEEMLEIYDDLTNVAEFALNFGEKEKGIFCMKHNYGPIDTWYDCGKCLKESKNGERDSIDLKHATLTAKQAFDKFRTDQERIQ